MASAHSGVKRALDFLVALMGTIVLSIFLFAPIALLIRLDSPGPVVYRRRVVGLNGREFDAFKFRTMVANADEYLHSRPSMLLQYQKSVKLRQDPRVTRLGQRLRRLSIDELPQLFNVLRGEMSLVGPRMVTLAELEKYGVYTPKLLTVRPGVTGLWQVSGRQDVSYDTRIQHDMDYIDNWSFLLDLKILLKTVPAVLGMRGAY